ncbi:hypothetical protein BDDG_13216, partial [Blastomyces dermatitidis ATCC 18188]
RIISLFNSIKIVSLFLFHLFFLMLIFLFLEKIIMSFIIHKHLSSDFIIQVKNIHVFRNRDMNIILFYIFALASEVILIEDDNITETTLFCSQASSITFSPFSVKKIVYILSH